MNVRFCEISVVGRVLHSRIYLGAVQGLVSSGSLLGS